MGSVYGLQVRFGVRLRSTGQIWCLSRLCRSIFLVCLRSAGDIFVRLRYARQFLGSVYAMQVKFEVRLRYAGQLLGYVYAVQAIFLGSVYAQQVIFRGLSMLGRSIFAVRLRYGCEILDPSTLCRSIFGGLSTFYR